MVSQNCVAATSIASFDEVVQVMKQEPYQASNLPLIPIQIFKWVGYRYSFFVGQRSREILQDKRDYRIVSVEKPIHPMGVGLTGKMFMTGSRFSGVFRGGVFPVVARASISQGNPLKLKTDGKMQVRSTAMGIKVFNAEGQGPTANAVFQNDLNGLLGDDGQPLNYLQSSQTNQPGLSFKKMKEAYEFGTLIGVALGTVLTLKEYTRKLPFINPQIRPAHSWAQMGENDIRDVKVPVWVKITPVLQNAPLLEDDFRLEITKTMAADKRIDYEIHAADQLDPNGQIEWQKVGVVIFYQAILAKGVDQNLLFPHDSLNSSVTDKSFKVPEVSK